MRTYPTIFKDKFGIEKSEFKSDGSDLYITLRGIKFEGGCFEMLEGKIDKSKFEFTTFHGEHELGDLKSGEFEIEFSIKLQSSKREHHAKLVAKISLDKGAIHLDLFTKDQKFTTTKSFGFFEDALIDIQNQLPEAIKLKTCLSCKYSHYSPGGNPMFGGLFCFRNMKKKASEIQCKSSLFNALEFARQQNRLLDVQETFDCEEHEFITENNWNNKNWK